MEATYRRGRKRLRGEVAFIGWALWACLAALIMPRHLHLLWLDLDNRLEVFKCFNKKWKTQITTQTTTTRKNYIAALIMAQCLRFI